MKRPSTRSGTQDRTAEYSPRMRNTRGTFPLSNINDGHIRYISKREGEQMFDDGQASRICQARFYCTCPGSGGRELFEKGKAERVLSRREHGKQRQLIGYAVEEVVGYKLTVTVNPADPGGPTLKKSDMVRNATGISRTMYLSERDKLRHVRRTFYASGVVVETLEPEDAVELAKAKVTLWPLERDTKAVRVGPLPDVAALKFAAELARTRTHYPA